MSAPRILVVHGAVPCRGTVHTPGEKSISHRSVLLGALAEGTSVIYGLSDGADVAASLAAVEAMGVGVEHREDGAIVLQGGRSRLHPPNGPADCGGIPGRPCASWRGSWPVSTGENVLVGDASLTARPMDRVVEPLTLMGAEVNGRGERCLPPLRCPGRPAARHRLDGQKRPAPR